MLIGDHRYSFSEQSLHRIFESVGLRIEELIDAPQALGHFRLALGRPGASPARRPERQEALFSARERFFALAQRLDERLSERIGESVGVVCFGCGEAAALLYVYAPHTWETVEACTMDAPGVTEFCGRSVVPYADLAPRTRVVVATSSRSARFVGERLRADGHEAILWDDLVEC
ncbi:MAG: hypothetical protein JO199_02160 [Candidatus Eremiobacteraeota bacterium]|nr:hypothetical protein [Candidatus Eremiobacteraeota bacterium]